MILLIHNNNKVIQVCNLDTLEELNLCSDSPIKSLFNLSEKFPKSILVWCHESQKNSINLDALVEDFHLKNMMMSYSKISYLPKTIGYVEDTPFINVNKAVKYSTWLMSSNIGAIYGSQLIKFKVNIKLSDNFDYVLNSIAKLGMSNGLLCYSNPRLLKENEVNISNIRASKTTLFKFVKQHYKTRWVFLLFLNFIIYNKQVLLIPFFKSLFYKKKFFKETLKVETLENSKKVDYNKTIDIIIPTIGRKNFLYNVLKDLSIQTVLPKHVIIVEQNPELNSISSLDYLSSKKWPFKIIHIFTNQAGVCNARNLALSKVKADFVYLADDDNRFESNLLELIIFNMQTFKFNVITMSYLQKNEQEIHKQPFQWSTFGAGSSVVSAKYLELVSFDIALEFGYGEDVDFGMQLRNVGLDIIYFPNLIIRHLKAPIGGFRKKVVQPWDNLSIQPKPSPTVMYNRLKNNSKYQLLGYKTILFFKYYKYQSAKNPITYFKKFKEQWKESINWANKLKNSFD